jgi:membrane protease YdiL (CAAX protease family)
MIFAKTSNHCRIHQNFGEDMESRTVKGIFLTSIITIIALAMNLTRFEYRYYIFPAALILLPIIFDKNFDFRYLSLPSKRGFKLFSLVSTLTIVFYPLIFFGYWIWFKGHSFGLPGNTQILSAISKGITGVLIAAIPEEFFFRGYLQEHVFKKYDLKILKVLSVKNILTSLLFGAVHAVAFLDITKAVTFFPSLVFGHLAEKSKGRIFYSVLFHVVANLLAFILWTFVK